MFNIVKKLVNYAENIAFRTYVDENQEHLTTQPIPEYIMIQTGQISANQTVNISLSRYQSSLKPESIFVSATSERDENLTIEIINTLTTNREIVFKKNLDSNTLPFEFPPTVLLPINDIEITANKNILNCVLLFRLAIVIDSWSLPTTQ